MRRNLGNYLMVTLGILAAACSGDSKGINEPTSETAQSFMDCATVEVVNLGANLSRSLTTADCQLGDGSYVDFYELRLTTARTVTITMASGAFDTFIVLLDRTSGGVVDLDDDGGGGTNSRIVTHLQPGVYIIGANSYEPGATGSYQLTVN